MGCQLPDTELGTHLLPRQAPVASRSGRRPSHLGMPCLSGQVCCGTSGGTGGLGLSGREAPWQGVVAAPASPFVATPQLGPPFSPALCRAAPPPRHPANWKVVSSDAALNMGLHSSKSSTSRKTGIPPACCYINLIYFLKNCVCVMQRTFNNDNKLSMNIEHQQFMADLSQGRK